MLAGMEIPQRPVRTVVDQQGGTPYVAIDFSRPVLEDLAITLHLRLPGLPGYLDVVTACLEEPQLEQGVTIDTGGVLRGPDGGDGFATRQLIFNFLWTYLGEGLRPDWNEDRFFETFGELKAQLSDNRVELHTTIPLTNLQMEVGSVEFGGQIAMMPASTNELDRWLNPAGAFFPINSDFPKWNSHYVDRPAVLHTSQSIVGRPKTTSLEDLRENPPHDVDVGNIITALRLVLSVPVSVIFHERRWIGLLSMDNGGFTSGRSPSMLEPVAILNDANTAEVKRVLNLLVNSPNIEALRLPLRRWEFSLFRSNLEDTLIDAWIGLEALLHGRSDGELTYRLSMRLSEFLGSSGVERQAIFQKAKRSYARRSALVHGSSTKKLADRRGLGSIAEWTRSSLRAALLKALALPGKFDPDHLENVLLGRDR